MDYFGTFLFFLETYHAVTHFIVLFRLRLLPAKDLARQGHYFLVDTLTVAASAFLYTHQFRWLAALQMIQHAFFYFTWNQHPYTIKVMQWSSLDWLASENHARWHWDVVLGTLFDLLVHCLFLSLIMQHLSPIEVASAVAAVMLLVVAILFNARFAWSNPGKEPAWVQRRISREIPVYKQE